ncbi:MAG: hypothetical protein ACKVOQ_13460 [Cyclobacteriaceae bacterium]
MTKEQAKESIAKLADRFREHREQYHAPDYNEAKTRQDFINPFFKVLGWDFLLQLNKDIQTEKLPANSEQIRTRIAHSEAKIDHLVYELYQLTPEEIKIVEGGSDE